MQHNIVLPDFGQTTSEAKIVQWLKKPGDRVDRGDPVVAVATDKVDIEVEAFQGGYVRKLLVSEGAMASAFAPVAIITDEADESYTVEDGAAATAPHIATAGTRPVAPSSHENRTAGAAPAARMLAKELNVDLAQIEGTGPKGLITRGDVEREAGNRALVAMAATVVASKRDIPHFYVTRDLELTAAIRWRDQWNSAEHGSRVSFNDIFVRCAALALADVPRLNTAYSNGKFEQRTAADVLLIVAREPALLLMPIADPRALAWKEFIDQMRDSTRAPQPKLAPLLAISNLGMYGVREFSAIIPPGCSSVLAIGAVREAAVVRDGRIAIEPVATVTVSADHRSIDGVTAARFLEKMQVHLNLL